jgi:hypothetical protein
MGLKRRKKSFSVYTKNEVKMMKNEVKMMKPSFKSDNVQRDEKELSHR